MAEIKKHPIGFRILSLFFWVGAVASGLTFISLLFRGSFIEPIWLLNPRAREGFAAMGLWATFLMLAVCSACVAAAQVSQARHRHLVIVAVRVSPVRRTT